MGSLAVRRLNIPPASGKESAPTDNGSCHHHPGCDAVDPPGKLRPESPSTPPLPPSPLPRQRPWQHEPLQQSHTWLSAHRTAAYPDVYGYPYEDAHAAAGGDGGWAWGPAFGGWPEEGPMYPAAGPHWAPAAPAAFAAGGGGAGPPEWANWEPPPLGLMGPLDGRHRAGRQEQQQLSPHPLLDEVQPPRTHAPPARRRQQTVPPMSPLLLYALCLAVAVAVAAALAHTSDDVALMRRQVAAANDQAAAVGARLSEIERGMWRVQQATWLAVERVRVDEQRQEQLRALQRSLGATTGTAGLGERGRQALPAGGNDGGGGVKTAATAATATATAATAAAATAATAAVAEWLRGLLPSSGSLWRTAWHCLLYLLPRHLDAGVLLVAVLALGWVAARQAVTVVVLRRQLAGRQGEVRSMLGRLESLERRWGDAAPRRRGR
ncbi:hypothetical protein PLESTM_001235800 [Pleodorina starrii]|nr:hypothetical protein PLESTM_001235800 [Pleodorina starrii]